MNQIHICLLLAISIHGLLFNHQLLCLQGSVLIVYTLFSFYFRKRSKMTRYMEENTIFWKDSKQGVVFGRLEQDLTRVIRKIESYGEKGKTLTYLALLIRCYAEAMMVKDFQKGFFFGTLKPTSEPDVCVVRPRNGKFESVLLRSAHRMTVKQIAEAIDSDAPPSLERQFKALGFQNWIPAFVLQMVTKTNCFLLKNFGVGIFMPEPLAAGVFYDLTSSSVSDYTMCHTDFNDSIAHITINRLEMKPMPDNGEVKMKPIVFINHCLDHRYMDGSDAYVFLKRFLTIYETLEDYI